MQEPHGQLDTPRQEGKQYGIGGLMEGVEGYQERHDSRGAQSHVPGGAQEEIHKASHEGRVEAVLLGKDYSEHQEGKITVNTRRPRLVPMHSCLCGHPAHGCPSTQQRLYPSPSINYQRKGLGGYLPEAQRSVCLYW